MAVSRALSTLGRLIRRTPPPQADVLEAYAHEVIPVMDRAEWLYQYWLEQSTLFTDGEKLGNVAAIHRWETATMGRSLERVVPPAPLVGAHESVIEALELASRAAQLLSSGSRFHNAYAVCEGQALLGASRERRLAALKSMRRYLLQVPPPQPPEVEVGAGLADGEDASDGTASGPALLTVDPDLATATAAPEILAEPPEPQPPTLPEVSPPAPSAVEPERAPPPTQAPVEAGTHPAPQPPAEPPSPVAQRGWGSLFGRPSGQRDQ